MNMSKIMKMMKHAGSIKKQTGKLTKQLKKKHFKGESHNKLVTLIMSGDKKLLSLHIDKKVVDAKDGDMLSDLILSTINETENKIDKYNRKAVKKQLGDLI